MIHSQLKIVAIRDNGGFMMSSQELETTGSHFADFCLDVGNPNFVKYAEAYGAQAHRVPATEQLQGLLSHCINTLGVRKIEVPIDYEENNRGSPKS